MRAEEPRWREKKGRKEGLGEAEKEKKSPVGCISGDRPLPSQAQGREDKEGKEGKKMERPTPSEKSRKGKEDKTSGRERRQNISQSTNQKAESSGRRGREGKKTGEIALTKQKERAVC